jgi:hypothetical protein
MRVRRDGAAESGEYKERCGWVDGDRGAVPPLKGGRERVDNPCTKTSADCLHPSGVRCAGAANRGSRCA